MNDLYHHAISVFLGFFAIMNPISNTTVFIGLTGRETRSAQNKIAFKSVTVAFLIILCFALFGKAIFHFFGISLPALRITGGILVFLIGYRMLQGESSKLHSKTVESNTDVAVSPLGIPILAGPGTIATAMSYSASGSWSEIVITLVSFAILCIITFICFILGQKLVKLVGENGINILTRLMGLILAVIGTQMLISGVFGAIELFGIS